MSMNCGQLINCPVLPDDQLYALEDPPLAQLNCRSGGAPIPGPTPIPPPISIPIGTNTVTIVACGRNFSASIAGMTSQQQQSVIDGLIFQVINSIQFCGGSFGLSFSGAQTPLQLFGNNPVSTTVTCPDGSIFRTTVPPCSVIAQSQAVADAIAKSQSQQAAKTPICLNPIPVCLCVGNPYSGTITQQGQAIMLTWTVVGAAPPGITVHTGKSSTLVIDGTPATPGPYTFKIVGTAADGSSVTKSITMSVMKVTTASLPGFAINVPYSFQMTATGGSSNLQWQITSGALPTGLTLSASGLISGTPTDFGVQPITFLVSDLTCEAAPPIPIIPRATLSTVSTTQFATVKGWSEFPGFVSSPPKKFHTITWTGSSEQQLWYQGVQIGGARYDFSGTDQIDTAGNITSVSVKNFSVMCNSGSDLTQSPIQQLQFMSNNRANIVGPTYPPNPLYSLAASFVGYFGTNNTQYSNLFGPTKLCGAPSSPYMLIGNVGGSPSFSFPSGNLVGFWGSNRLGGQNSFMGISAVTFPSNVLGVSNDSGQENVAFNPYALELLPPGLILEQFSQLQTPIGIIPRPGDWNATATVIFTNNFSATLSNEYTDAEALTNAITSTGNSTTAVNLPRTTGFESTFTTVVFTVTCTNLIAGKTYFVDVTFQDLTSGVPTTKEYSFLATSSIGTVTDTIPQPPAGHSVEVRSPKVRVSA